MKMQVCGVVELAQLARWACWLGSDLWCIALQVHCLCGGVRCVCRLWNAFCMQAVGCVADGGPKPGLNGARDCARSKNPLPDDFSRSHWHPSGLFPC